MKTFWETRFAQRTARMKSSTIRELLKLTQNPEVISFAGGLPSPDVFPVDEFKGIYDKVLSTQGVVALQYGTTEGYLPLRETIAERMEKKTGVKIKPENIQIANGSQQIMDLLGTIFINPGDYILTEYPTYLGALQVWSAYQAEFVTANTDRDGIIPESLREALRQGPKFIYSIPTFQNPTGISYTVPRKEALVELSSEFGVPVVEDDPYGELRFEGEPTPLLLELDSSYHDCTHDYIGNVIYTSTFSKTLAPGLRIAWAVAPEKVIDRLVQAKQGSDLHTSTINQMVVYELVSSGFMDEHLKVIIETYKRRRDLMLDAMEEFFPDGVSWTKPEGGMFLWVTLPEKFNSAVLFKKAVAEQNVAYVPGESFFPNGGGENTMRLNYSNASDDMIVEGIRRLGTVFKQEIVK